MSLKEQLLLEAELWWSMEEVDDVDFESKCLFLSFRELDEIFSGWKDGEYDKRWTSLSDEALSYLTLLIAETIEE